MWEKPLTAGVFLFESFSPSPENAGHIRCYYNLNKDNMVLSDVGVATRETTRFKALGGSTIGEHYADFSDRLSGIVFGFYRS
jgi:hypothetical protein